MKLTIFQRLLKLEITYEEVSNMQENKVLKEKFKGNIGKQGPL
jgi:hypothetical protein